MSSGDTERPDRERSDDEIEVARARSAESRATEHPAPPAEGKWRGILGQVRGLLARGRTERRRSS
jgi:hypothetical protein